MLSQASKTPAPEIDLARCVVCLGCAELCPEVFRLNPAGYIEIADLAVYPVDCIDQAIAICPKDCLFWA